MSWFLGKRCELNNIPKGQNIVFGIYTSLSHFNLIYFLHPLGIEFFHIFITVKELLLKNNILDILVFLLSPMSMFKWGKYFF